MAEKEWELRRKDRMTENHEARKMVEKGTYGLLATVGEAGEPYAVPLSYVFLENRIYFHCAKVGRKLENLQRESRACFVVVGKNGPVYRNNFTSVYESVIVEGTTSIVEDADEKRKALLELCEKYLPEHMDKAQGDIDHSFGVTQVVRLDIQRMTGKANR